MSDISIDAANVALPGRVSAGVALGAARRAQNLSIDDVARQLRLSVSQVKAIEADAYEHLPGPVFVRGFIRNYARLLRMDPDALLRDADTGERAPAQRVSVPLTRDNQYPPARHSRIQYYVVVVLALVAGLGWYEFHFSPGDSATPAAVPVISRDPAPTAIPVEAPVATPAETLAPAAGAAASESRLQLQFAQASWVEIRDGSGATLLSQTMPAGSERTLSGQPPYTLIIGNARAVRVSHNDIPQDLAPYTVNDVARLTVK